VKAWVSYVLVAVAALCAAGFVGSRFTAAAPQRSPRSLRIEASGVKPAASNPDTLELMRQVRALQEEVVRLRGAVETAPRVAERGSETEPEEPRDEEQSGAENQRASDAYAERTLMHYAAAFESEGRGLPAAEFERAVRDEVALTGHTSVNSVDCRSSLCRLVLRHDTPMARMRLSRLAASATLGHGWHYHPSPEDELETIAFIGMPDHPLQPPPLENPGDDAASAELE
jgi:hypothetical protein